MPPEIRYTSDQIQLLPQFLDTFSWEHRKDKRHESDSEEPRVTDPEIHDRI